MDDLALVRSVAPEVTGLVPAAECPRQSHVPMPRYLQRASHSKPVPGIHLAVYQVADADDSVWSLGWEWGNFRWAEGSLWEGSDGRAGGDLLLMWAASALSWKVMWGERSGRLIATAYAKELDELLAWWGRTRVAVLAQ